MWGARAGSSFSAQLAARSPIICMQTDSGGVRRHPAPASWQWLRVPGVGGVDADTKIRAGCHNKGKQELVFSVHCISEGLVLEPVLVWAATS